MLEHGDPERIREPRFSKRLSMFESERPIFPVKVRGGAEFQSMLANEISEKIEEQRWLGTGWLRLSKGGGELGERSQYWAPQSTDFFGRGSFLYTCVTSTKGIDVEMLARSI